MITSSDYGDVSADDCGFDIRSSQPIKCGAVGHRLNEVAASLRSVGLELVAIHAGYYRI
jgi:hypothetical protein